MKENPRRQLLADLLAGKADARKHLRFYLPSRVFFDDRECGGPLTLQTPEGQREITPEEFVSLKASAGHSIIVCFSDFSRND